MIQSRLKISPTLMALGIFIMAMIMSLKNYPPSSWTPYDGALYIDIARNLSEDFTDFSYQGIYMMFRPPIYPYTLSIIYRLVPLDLHLTVARLISSVFYSGTAMLIFILFRRYLGDLKAIIASILYMLNPIALGMSIQPLVHSQFTFFYLISVYYLLKWSENRNRISIVLFGIFTGISILTRYTGFSLGAVAIAFIYLLIISQKINLNYLDILKHLTIGALSAFLILLPWMILGHLNYTGFMSPFTVASREVNMAASRTPLTGYLLSIIETLSLPAVMVTTLGLMYSMFQRDKFHILLVSWSLAGFVSILTIIHKEVRFITFLTPPIALLSTEGLYVISKVISEAVLRGDMKYKGIKIIGITILILLSISCYTHANEYTSKYYYSGSTQAILFDEFKKIVPTTDEMILLVSPNLYPYAGLFLPHAKIYQMSSYNINWLVHGLRGKQPPDIPKMIENGYFDYIIYCKSPYLDRWIDKVGQSPRYYRVKEMFNGRCRILANKDFIQ